MNYELDSYLDAINNFPSKEIQLETIDNTYYHFKTDVFKGIMSYSTSQNFGANVVAITARRAKEVIAMNKKGMKPDLLDDHSDDEVMPTPIDYENGVGQDSLTRFDTNKKRQGGKSNKRPVNRPQPTKPENPENKTNVPRFQKPVKKNEPDVSKNNE